MDGELYFVWTWKPRPGKSEAAEQWWNESGKALYANSPGVKSVRTFVSQFGLGGEYPLEIWLELENYAAFDWVLQDIASNPKRYAPLAEYDELFEPGPSRIVAPWPESPISS